MSERLFGQEALLDGLVPRLVGLERIRERRVGFEFHDDAPVVVVVGGRCSGKSALLDALYAGYTNRVPLALVDLEEDSTVPGASGPPPAEARNSSGVTQLLYLLSYALGLRTHRVSRPLRFPRLSLGLLVVTAWRPGGDAAPDDVRPAGLRDAEAGLRAVIAEENTDHRRRREVLKQWFDALLPTLPALVPGVPVLDAVLRATLTTARDQLLSPRADREALRWWGRHLTGFQGDDLQRLFTFVRDFRRRDDGRPAVEGLLVEAFLDDIAGHYGVLSRLNKAPAPLILLDNAHTRLGRHFMDLLVRARDRTGGGSRPVVVAARLGDASAHTPLRDVAERTPWRPAAQGPPEQQLLTLGLPPVDLKDIVGMLSRVDYPPFLPRLVQRFSGGRPGSARILADAVAQAGPAAGDRDAAAILALPATPAVRQRPGRFTLLTADPGGADRADPASDGRQTVHDMLLRQLLPQGPARTRLTLLSAALDDLAARSLWDTFHPDDSAAVRVREAKDQLDPARWRIEHWPGDGTAMPFVADRALRALLVHRLRTEADDERWTRVHRRLRAVYNRNGLPAEAVGHGVPYLHHTLALGDVETVVRCLHHRLASDRPREWLAMVNVICAAPAPHGGIPAPVAAPAAGGTGGCPACPRGGPDPVHRAVDRLVRAVQAASDPLSAMPAPGGVDRVRSALQTLYEHHDGTDTFLRAHRDWPDRLQDGVQAPDLPVPEGPNT